MREVPTADEVACAVIAASRRAGTDPAELLTGFPAHHVRTRSVATMLLGERFTLATARLAALVGARRHRTMPHADLQSARKEFDRLLARHAGGRPEMSLQVEERLAAREPRLPAATPPDPAPIQRPEPEPVPGPRRAILKAPPPPVERRPPMISLDPGKRALRDLLAEALANTGATKA